MKFVLDRTRPKQLGACTMTGPILAGMAQSFLYAINIGDVPIYNIFKMAGILRLITTIWLMLVLSVLAYNLIGAMSL